jgi:hypothetical protein
MWSAGPFRDPPGTGGDVAATVEVRQMKKLRLTRAAHGAVIAMVLAAVWAAPAAAAQPTRTVYALDPFVYPSGTACAFDVEGEPTGGFIARTTFSDGTVQLSVRARGAYVNLATGARFPTQDTFRDLSRFDDATGILVGTENGETTWIFLPGDMGPFGVVGSNGALYHFVGTVQYTYDTNVNHSTQFAHTGTVTDICAALS